MTWPLAVVIITAPLPLAAVLFAAVAAFSIIRDLRRDHQHDQQQPPGLRAVADDE